MSEQRAYVRVYWSIIDDPKFVEVYDNDRALAAWLRLLIAADQAWPASAFVPMSCNRAALDLLVRVGLVDRMPGTRYRIHGLDAERNSRAERGKAGASARWMQPQSVGNANALREHPAPVMQVDASRAEPSRDEPSIAPAREGLPNLNSAVAHYWEEATGRSVLGSGAKVAEYLDDACRRHPPSEVSAKIINARKTFDHIPEVNAMLSALRQALDPFPDRKAAASKESEAAEATRRRRAVESTLAGNHALGAHAVEAHPRCPSCREGAA